MRIINFYFAVDYISQGLKHMWEVIIFGLPETLFLQKIYPNHEEDFICDDVRPAV